MAGRVDQRKIEVRIFPKRDNFPDVPNKVIDNAFREGKKKIHEEIKKYFDTEKESADIEVK